MFCYFNKCMCLLSMNVSHNVFRFCTSIRILDLVECKDDINRNITKMYFDVGQEHSQNNRSIKETYESYSI